MNKLKEPIKEPIIITTKESIKRCYLAEYLLNVSRDCLGSPQTCYL